MTDLHETTEKEPIETRRKRLIFRSWHRGTRETDLILGSFADKHLPDFDKAQLDQYEALLTNGDPDIYDWMTGRTAPPAEYDTDILRMLSEHQPSAAPKD